VTLSCIVEPTIIPKRLVAAARRVHGGQKILFQRIPKISFYPQNFLMTFFSHWSKSARK